MTHKQIESERHIVDVLFVLALFGVFAACALLLVMLGAGVYKSTISDMSDNFNSRTTYSYMTEKLRQNDFSGAVSIGELEGVPALTLTEYVGDEAFCTYLYLYDGYLKELFIRKDSFVGTDILSVGQNITALTDFSMEKPSENLLKLTLDTGNGDPIILYATLRSDT